MVVVKHNKTENLYLLVNDKCKVKINGEWVDAVIYQGKDKESGKTKCFVREKSDFDSHFTEVGGIDLNLERSWLFYQIYTLKEVAEEYPGKTVENIIAQLEARRKEIGNSAIE